MTDLRKAAEQAVEAIMHGGVKEQAAAVHELRQALAHEALDRMVAENERLGLYVDAVNTLQKRVDETAKREHEPFIYVREDNERPFGGYEHCSEADAGAFPVYTAPPKREWVGLTDEEIVGMTCECVNDGTFNMDCARDYARWIESNLKEKNHALR